MTEIDREIKDIKKRLDINWRKVNKAEKEVQRGRATFKKLNGLRAERRAIIRELQAARTLRDELEAIDRSTKHEQQVAGMNPAIRTGRNRNFSPHR